MARPSKNPRGGPWLLFLTGLGIEVLVGAVAARAFLGDAIADSGILPGPKVSDVSPARAAASGLDDEVGTALASSAAVCWGLADPSDHGSDLTVTLTVRGGRVSTARVEGVSGLLAACVEAEALEWRLTPSIQQIEVTRTQRLSEP